ncbi:MAG: hypothetical protein A2W91_02235 [Bacteroidetes bacterium GWF2_38_335]|nr:MAG: hypothetical protein A2W91_02235 [Bacteroidetes bacterium GWF2_38_335]OFY80670.1 MAG: hypothetical protein A2281_05250 [Bacteroidetes bacterium RIFOXYA12_FULL_38_20]HBS87013.1 EamA family transporter [Bacteroidales bacterium]
MKKQKLSYIYALSAILLWSTIAVAFKISLRDLSPHQLLFNAILVSTVFFIIVLAAQKKIGTLFRFTFKQYLFSAFVGLLNPFLYYVVLLEAYDILPAQIAQPLNYTWPVLLVLLSVPILKQKINYKSILAIMVSFTGVIIISLQGDLSMDIKNPLGVILAVGSSLMWALFWLLNVRDKREETVKLFLNFIFALIYITIILLLFSDFKIPETDSLIASVYVGIFEMGITFILWLKALSMTSSTDKIGNLVFISPFLSLFWISMMLGESIYISTIFGLIMLISGIILQRIFAK